MWHTWRDENPIFIRPLTEDEQRQIQAGLRSSDAFVLRRCQMLSASAREERVPQIARQVGCDDQVVRNVIHGSNASDYQPRPAVPAKEIRSRQLDCLGLPAA